MAAENESAGEQAAGTAQEATGQEHESAHIADESHATAATVPENPFDRDEIKQFEADDVQAGKSIGQMLSLMFIYTVIVMALVGYLTWSKILH